MTRPIDRRSFLTGSVAAAAVVGAPSQAHAGDASWAWAEREYYELRRYHIGSGEQQELLLGHLGEYSISTRDGDWSTKEIPARNGGSYAAMAGMTSCFQAWHRDVHPTGAAWAQLSHGLEILWY